MENFNALSAERIGFFQSLPAEITCCDFSPAQRILAIGLKDGTVRLLDPASLKQTRVLHYDPKQEKQAVVVTAVNCRSSGHIVVGYSNGIAKEFGSKDSAPLNIYVAVDLALSSPEGKLPISHIAVAERDHRIFVIQNGADKCMILGFETGSSSARTRMQYNGGRAAAVEVLERTKTLALLGTKNELAIFNYVDGEMIVKLDISIPGLTEGNSVVSAEVVPVNKQMRQVYVGEAETCVLDQSEDPAQSKGDVIFLGFEKGEILSGKLVLTMAERTLECALLPYNVYKAQIGKTTSLPSLRVQSLHVDPVTDLLVAATQDGVRLFDRTLVRILNPEKARKEDEKSRAEGTGWVRKLGLGKLFGKRATKLVEMQERQTSSPSVSTVVPMVTATATGKKEAAKTEEKREASSAVPAAEGKKALDSRQIFERLANSAKREPQTEPAIQHEEEKKQVAEAKDEPRDETKKEEQRPPAELQHEKSLDPELKIELQ